MPTATDAALRRSTVLWLSSVGADGRPHVVPAWFIWDGDRIVLFSKPKARKIRTCAASRARWSESARPDRISTSS
jgi:nitroimidazol reductase NimA-like FMN-containing flavoprotein (pyridoxamine 5'-phosphate oxidase superfamily)